jgi:hypothetical protein
MRRSLLPALLLATLIAPGAAHASQTAALDVSAQLLNQPVGRPWSINLGTTVTVSTPDGAPPSPLQSVDIRFPQATLNDDRFPACAVNELELRGPSACPKASKVGHGVARADVRPLLDFLVDVDLQVFVGPEERGGRMLLFHAQARQIPAVELILKGLLRKTQGRYGYRLTLEIPEISTVPGSPPAAVTFFDVQVGGKNRGRSFLEAPRSCPRSGLPFAGAFGYADGTSSSTTAKIDCTLRSTRG